ncbi:MAG: RAMP superfamily CRISPR-associated protein, partial [Desulfotomaculaceae bacterium]|nr:RAMP superfamily CRISPR-associated protein [Desulfotomaculaceae bacterium]
DTAHLHSWRGDKIVPILSGASLAGALRSRALRIAKTFGDSAVTNELITDLFGPDKQNENPKASRLIVEEKEIINPSEMVVNRVRIDRFTGGAYRSALFDESPIFGLNETQVQIDLMVQNPKDEDVGLLLLLLKDLWTGDLPLGGETGIGRGRLKGLEARLTGKNNGLFEKEWLLKRSTDDRLIIEGNSQDLLEAYVQSFIREVSRIDN